MGNSPERSLHLTDWLQQMSLIDLFIAINCLNISNNLIRHEEFTRYIFEDIKMHKEKEARAPEHLPKCAPDDLFSPSQVIA